MSLKDKVITYLQSDRRISIYISELDETVYSSPVMGLEMEKIMTISQENSKDFHVYTWIEKIEDAEGKKLFLMEDKPYLEKLDWDILSRVSNHIHKKISVPDAKKNSQTTPS